LEVLVGSGNCTGHVARNSNLDSQNDPKIPASDPNCWLLRASSLFIVNAAKPLLIRSRKATTKRTRIKGIMRIWIFRMVLASTSNGDMVSSAAIATMGIRPCADAFCHTQTTSCVKAPIAGPRTYHITTKSRHETPPFTLVIALPGSSDEAASPVRCTIPWQYPRASRTLLAATSRVRAALPRSTPGCRKNSSTFHNHAPDSASAYAPSFFTLLKYVPCSRSGISPGCFGCHPRSSRVRLLEAGQSTPTKCAIQPK